MTALKPIENRRVRAVPSKRYPLNVVCAHPECREPAVDPHHIFPRSAIGGDSWFVLIIESDEDWRFAEMEVYDAKFFPIPHVTGLCRAHHDDVEEHRAWIKLEEGEFRWYDRHDIDIQEWQQGEKEWTLLGPLNPQPGSHEGKPKRRKFAGQARRQRTTISVKVPKDEQENGAGLWDEAIESLEEKISGEDHRPPYYTIMDALNYTLLNTTEEDFNG